MKTLWLQCLALIVICGTVNSAFNIENGGVITEDTTVDIFGSPYRISTDILVAKGVKLTIEAGVEMQFAPRVMLAVNGTLVARVSIYQNSDNIISRGQHRKLV